MSDDPGPWGRLPPSEPPEPPRRVSPDRWRWAILLAVLAAVGLGVWGLNELLPGQVNGTDDWSHVARLTLLLGLIGAGIMNLNRFKLGQQLRYAAIWAGVFAVFVVGYAYRKDFVAVGQRIRGEFLPAHPLPAGPRALVISQSGDGGGYFIMGKLDGVVMRFLIDTGASGSVTLSPDDARRLGLAIDGLKFDKAYGTANGVGLGADGGRRRLEVGPIRMDAVPIEVNQAPMSSSILGRDFLSRLDGFDAKDGKLTLRWKG